MTGEFAGTLRERIVFERPASVRDAMGLRQWSWEPFFRCLAAIRLEGAGPESEAMSLSAMPRFRVTIRAREGLSIDQRIRWGDRLLMIKQLLADPLQRDRIVLRCEEMRT